MFNRGAVAILGILGLGVVMASVAVWYHAQTGRRCLDTWGVEAARLIRHAPLVDALRLGPASPDSPASLERLDAGAAPLVVLDRLPIGEARGLIHARHALISDHQFEPAAAAGEPPSGGTLDATERSANDVERWKYALQFTEGRRQATLLFDPVDRTVRLLPGGAQMQLRRKTMDAEIGFIEREFSEAAKPETAKPAGP